MSGRSESVAKEDRYQYATYTINTDLSGGLTQWKGTRMREQNTYERDLKSYHVFLYILGLHFNARSVNKVTGMKLLHLVILVMMCFNMLRYFAAYSIGESFGVFLITKMAAHTVMFWGASSAMAGTFISLRRPHLFEAWNEYLDNYKVESNINLEQKHRRRVNVACVLACIAIVGTISAHVASMYNPNMQALVAIQLLPFYDVCEPYKLNQVLLKITIIVEVYCWVIFLVQLIYTLLLITALSDEFVRYNSDFNKHIKRSKPDCNILQGSIEDWRSRHRGLCGVVKILDDGIGMYILLLFISIIPLCCFVVFCMFMTDFTKTGTLPLVWTTLIPLFIMCLTILMGITLTGSNLNHQVS